MDTTKVSTIGPRLMELEKLVARLECERNAALMAVDLLAQRVNKADAQIELLALMLAPKAKEQA